MGLYPMVGGGATIVAALKNGVTKTNAVTLGAGTFNFTMNCNVGDLLVFANIGGYTNHITVNNGFEIADSNEDDFFHVGYATASTISGTISRNNAQQKIMSYSQN